MLIPRSVRQFTVRYPLSIIYVLLFCTFAFGLFWSHHIDQRSIHRAKLEVIERTNTNCVNVRHSWDTFQAVIEAATNPPALAGKPISPEQRAALKSYHDALVAAVGPRPACEHSPAAR